jgi:hypothetical protein
MAYGRRFGGNSKSFSSGGSVYKTGSSTYEVRRHTLQTTVHIEPQKSKIIPLLAYNDIEGYKTTVSGSSKIVAQGSHIYPTLAVEDGSRVNAISLDVTIQTKDGSSSQIIPFYVGRIATSFHDVKGGNIYGLEADGDTGKIKYSDEIEASPTLTDVVNSTGAMMQSPELNLTKDQYNTGDIIKHWIRNVRKNVIYGGQPVVYQRWEKTPSKCKRSNKGMFYGLIVMNDSKSITGDTDVLEVVIKQQFNEIPLIQ